MTLEINTSNAEDTRALARRLAQLLQGGEVIELQSDLGGGKTTFVQGLAAGLGYSGPVTSPTFTLNNIYQLPHGLQLQHYDLYRLDKAGIMANELAENLGNPSFITVLEWAGVAQAELPLDRIVIVFEVIAESGRSLVITSGGPLSTALLDRLVA